MGAEKGLVSVVMPAYNAAATVAESVRSVLGQSYPDWELIVVNDGSTDATSAVLAPFLADPRVRLIEQPNAGVGAARNTGIRRSRGEFVAFLDADDLWQEGKLALQVALFASAPASLGLVHTRYRSFTGDPVKSRPKDDDPCFGRLPPERRILVYDFIATSTVMVRARLFQSVGLFDEKLAGTEDWDLWIRILAGHGEQKIDEALVLYRENPNGLSGNTARHLAEEWKVIVKQVLPNRSLARRIKAKAVFYHQAKELNHLLATRSWARFFKRAAASVVRSPLAYCDPGNYLDLFSIFLNRNIRKRW